MWGLSCPTRDLTRTPALEGKVLTAGHQGSYLGCFRGYWRACAERGNGIGWTQDDSLPLILLFRVCLVHLFLIFMLLVAEFAV